MVRPAKYTHEEAARRHLEAATRWQDKITTAARDIGDSIPWDGVNWKRRKRCKKSLKTFCETYLKRTCSLGWSKDQEIFLELAQKSMSEGGKCAVGMPRGGGKSTLSRATVLYGICYGFTRYVTFVAATEKLAVRAMDFIKANLYGNELLQQDFPEICYAIKRLNNRGNLARGQLCHGRLTEVVWSSDSIRMPIITMPEEVAKSYLKQDKKSVIKVKKSDGSTEYMSAQSWVIVNVAGITGNIRGSNETHPLTLEVIRPDFVILDDIQDDQSAINPETVKYYIRLVDGTIEGLAGPDGAISGLMPCTVIAVNDVADQYLSHEVKPEWHGVRCKMILQYPEGIDDYTISCATESGRLWLEYIDLRKKSHQVYCDNRLALEFYKEHRKEMDAGFEVTWPERYDRKTEVSAIQSAMEKKIKNPETFASEYQQIGINLNEVQTPVITAKEFAGKMITNATLGTVPDWCQELVAFVDIQEECLFWCVMGFKNDFTAFVADYGTYPEIPYRIFTKQQVKKWQLLSNDFLQSNAINPSNWVVDDKGVVKVAPEAKYTHGVDRAVTLLKSKVYRRLDTYQTPMRIRMVGIDATRGQNTNVVRQYCAANSSQDLRLFPHFGQYISPNNIQMAEQQRKPGWIFESDWNRNSRTCKWILKQTSQFGYEFHTETSMTKDFLMARIAAPIGSPGCMYLYGADPYVHELFTAHVCESEYPQQTIGKIVKNQWKERSNAQDNDWLDCLVGCCTLASYCHATYDTIDLNVGKTEVPSISQIAAEMRAKAANQTYNYDYI